MNTLGNLNAYLFEQMERLNEVKLDNKDFDKEVIRGKAIGQIAKNIIDNGNLVLSAHKLAGDMVDADAKIPKMLEGDL